MIDYKQKCSDWYMRSVDFFKPRPYLVHCLVIFIVTIYVIIGGCIFAAFEQSTYEERTENQEVDIIKCVADSLSAKWLSGDFTSNSAPNDSKLFFEKCFKHHLETPGWDYQTSIFFAFTVLCTVGFSLRPQTSGGQVFFIAFALFGIPLCMLMLANIGGHIKRLFCKVVDRGKAKRIHVRDSFRRATTKRRRRRKATMDDLEALECNNNAEVEEETEQPEITLTDMSGWMLVCLFLLYVLLGAIVFLMVTIWKANDSGFINAYFNTFSCLTGGDFSILSRGSFFLVLIKLIYAAIGLAIATIAIDVCSSYFRRLHHFGEKPTNVKNTKIWFGGQQMTVDEFMNMVGEQFGISRDQLNSIDLDNMVHVATQEKSRGVSRPPSRKPTEPTVEPLEIPEPEPSPPEETIPEIHIEDRSPSLDTTKHTTEDVDDDVFTRPRANSDFPMKHVYIGDKKFFDSAVKIVPEPEPGRTAIRNDPEKRLKLYEAEWMKFARLDPRKSRSAQELSCSSDEAPRRKMLRSHSSESFLDSPANSALDKTPFQTARE